MTDYRDVYEGYKEYLTTYVLAQCIVEIKRDEDGDYFFDTPDLAKEVYLLGGFAPDDWLAEAFSDFDFKEIDREGIWDIEGLFKKDKGDEYERGGLETLLLNCTFIQTIEERDAQQNDITDLFGNQKTAE